MSFADETIRNRSKKNEDSFRFYDYISTHFQYIQQSPFVNIESKKDCYECMSSKPFYANDGHYNIGQIFIILVARESNQTWYCV